MLLKYLVPPSLKESDHPANAEVRIKESAATKKRDDSNAPTVGSTRSNTYTAVYPCSENVHVELYATTVVAGNRLTYRVAGSNLRYCAA